MPHDLSLTAAMVFIVIILRIQTNTDNLRTTVNGITSDWLTSAGSPLEAFPQLSVCHALLAKLPLSALLVDVGGKPCLLELFPSICHLLDRYASIICRIYT